jgi:hypothetical protein
VPRKLDQPTVGQQHDAVGVGGADRVVGDHHDGLPVPVHQGPQLIQDVA